jgi:hypothetical protein
MTLNELRDEVLAYAKNKGFEKSKCFGESLMLVVSELSEALEADRKGKWCGNPLVRNSCYTDDGKPVYLLDCDPNFRYSDNHKYYEDKIKGTVEEEIADAFLRLFGLAGFCNIDLDFHVTAKMAYNKTRPYKCGKNYG